MQENTGAWRVPALCVTDVRPYAQSREKRFFKIYDTSVAAEYFFMLPRSGFRGAFCHTTMT